jgi:hypothetical protein
MKIIRIKTKRNNLLRINNNGKIKDKMNRQTIPPATIKSRSFK